MTCRTRRLVKVIAINDEEMSMDYEREDRIASKRAQASLESQRRVDAGEYPFTLLEAAHALGLDSPVSHEDLVTLGHVCYMWNVRTNIDSDPCFNTFRQ